MYFRQPLIPATATTTVKAVVRGSRRRASITHLNTTAAHLGGTCQKVSRPAGSTVPQTDGDDMSTTPAWFRCPSAALLSGPVRANTGHAVGS